MHTERSTLCLLQQIEKMLLNAHILLNVLILINSLRFKLCWTSTIISRISMRPLHSKWILFTLFCSFWKHILNLMSILMISTWNLNLTSLVQSSRNFIFCCFWYLLWFDLRNINLVYTFMWKMCFMSDISEPWESTCISLAYPGQTFWGTCCSRLHLS